MAHVLQSICIYAGSHSGTKPEYAEAASNLATHIATSRRTLIYGGGGIGLMGDAARAAMKANGRVIGVIPSHLNTRERAYREVELRVVRTMHERKQLMADLSDAFIALPGGLGTFDELFEILTWNQIGLHGKPVGILNVAGYYDGLLTVIDQAVREGFTPEVSRKRLVVDSDPVRLVEAMEQLAARSR